MKVIPGLQVDKESVACIPMVTVFSARTSQCLAQGAQAVILLLAIVVTTGKFSRLSQSDGSVVV